MARRTFYPKAVSRKRSWIKHRILYPNNKRIRQAPDELNNFYVITSKHIVGPYPEQKIDFPEYLKSLWKFNGYACFRIRQGKFL